MDSPSNKTKTSSPAAADSSLHLIEQPPLPMVVAGYRECRKNHAVRLGRLALDGCREFMPSSTGAALSDDNEVPGYLRCAACGCHRNFHRRDYSASPGPAWSPPSPRPLSPVPTSYYAPAPWMLRAPGNWTSGFPKLAVSLPDVNGDDGRLPGVRGRRKRERTKFSKEQKEKMEAFAEQVGWKMKTDGDDEKKKKAVEEFCREVGVSRGVLKIWMNNHKRKHKHRKVYLVDGDCDS